MLAAGALRSAPANMASDAGSARYLLWLCWIRSLFTKLSHTSIGSDRYVRRFSHHRLAPLAIYKGFAHNVGSARYLRRFRTPLSVPIAMYDGCRTTGWSRSLFTRLSHTIPPSRTPHPKAIYTVCLFVCLFAIHGRICMSSACQLLAAAEQDLGQIAAAAAAAVTSTLHSTICTPLIFTQLTICTQLTIFAVECR